MLARFFRGCHHGAHNHAPITLIDRIADGRTDLVFDYLATGHAASSTDKNGVPLIKWCAHPSPTPRDGANPDPGLSDATPLALAENIVLFFATTLVIVSL